ncbi:MAG: WbqC family protein, partial [Candidatus Omnitrophota bacterium]
RGKRIIVGVKRVAIIQPGYLPWLGFFELMASSDIFIVYDDVQFDKNGWRNRNKIKTIHGVQWLTVPVLTKGKNWPKNNDVFIKDKRWKRKHLRSIEQYYAKAKYFGEVFPIMEKGLKIGADKLIDYDMFFIREMAKYMNINTDIFLSSELGIEGDDKAGRLINICKHFDATHYYNGAAGKKLYKKEDFLKHGIELEFQDYKHPCYEQLHGDFVPCLSTVDLLFNEGASSLDIILSGRNVV